MNLVKIFVVGLACVPLVSAAQQELATQKQRLSYAVGVNMAQRIQQNIDVDAEALTAGIRDVLSGAGSKLSAEQARSRMVAPDGFSIDLITAEPDLVQPIAMCFDAKGRIWVIEGNTYPQRAPEGEGKDRVVRTVSVRSKV